MGAVRDSATYLAEHIHEAPVLMIPCIEGREDKQPMGGAGYWASLFPAVWSLLPGAAVARARHLLDDAASDSWR